MKKKSSFLLMLIFFIAGVNAQPLSMEKTKVLYYFQNQQYEDAINYLLPLERNDSTNIEALGFLGYANYMNENIPAAERYYQKIFFLDSNNISAVQYLSSIYSKQKTREALLLTYRLINLQPGKTSYYRQMGDLYRKLNENDSSLFYYQHAYNLSPEDVKNEISLADMLVEENKFLAADSILNPALAKDSMNTRLIELRLKSAYEAKDYVNALPPGERLMKIDGIYITGLTQLALSYYFLKKYTDCIRVCNYLEAKGVISESLYYYEGKAWSKLKNYEKSNDLLQQCVQMAISKTAESYYYALGENYESLSMYKKAINRYDTAFYLFRNPIMEYNSGRIAESNLKNYSLAKKYYTVYLTLAKPQSTGEKKAYAYVKNKWARQKPSKAGK